MRPFLVLAAVVFAPVSTSVLFLVLVLVLVLVLAVVLALVALGLVVLVQVVLAQVVLVRVAFSFVSFSLFLAVTIAAAISFRLPYSFGAPLLSFLSRFFVFPQTFFVTRSRTRQPFGHPPASERLHGVLHSASRFRPDPSISSFLSKCSGYWSVVFVNLK